MAFDLDFTPLLPQTQAPHFWFNGLGLPEVRVAKATANTASRRISGKNGMRVVHICESDYVSGRLPTEVWSITAEEWRRHGSSALQESEATGSR